MPLPQSPMGCPMDAILRLVMGQWTCLILWRLAQRGPMRFGALKREIEGISSKVLTERLRMLEDYGILFRDVRPTSPPEVTYGLTSRGDELIKILDPLFHLACRWLEEDQQHTSQNCGST